MKFTIDTLKKRITIHGSFTYKDYKKVIKLLPTEWVVFEFRGGSEPEVIPEMVYPPLDDSVAYPSINFTGSSGHIKGSQYNGVSNSPSDN